MRLVLLTIPYYQHTQELCYHQKAMEQVLFRVHVRLITNVTTFASKPLRALFEKFLLICAIISMIFLAYLHLNYVSPRGQSIRINCIDRHLHTLNITNITYSNTPYDIYGIHIIHITPNIPSFTNQNNNTLYGYDYNDITSHVYTTSNHHNHSFLGHTFDIDNHKTQSKLEKISFNHLPIVKLPNWYNYIYNYYTTATTNSNEHSDTCLSTDTSNTCNTHPSSTNQHTQHNNNYISRSYLYSYEKGYLLLSSTIQQGGRMNLTRLDVYIPANNKCLQCSVVPQIYLEKIGG